MNRIKSKFGAKLPSLALQPPSPTPEPPPRPTDCDHIWGPFYISDYCTAQNKDFLQQQGFTHIVVCAASCASLFEESFVYCRVDLKDRVSESLLHAIAKFIHFMSQVQSEDPKILLHCREGKSRAPIILSSFLVWKLGVSFEEALSMVRARRPKIDPNFGFLINGSEWFEQRLSRTHEADSQRDRSLEEEESSTSRPKDDILNRRLGLPGAESKISHTIQSEPRLARRAEAREERTMKRLSCFKTKRRCLKNELLERTKRRMQWKRSSSSTSTTVSESSPRRAPCSV